MPSVLGRSATSLSGPAACARADARSGPRHPVRSQTAQAATDFAARSRERNCQSRRCPPVCRERTGAEERSWWDSSRRFWTKPGSRKLTGGVRCHLRGPVLSRVFWTCQARRSGADSESCENSEGEARGGRGVSRKQGAQGFERPRRRSRVLAPTRRCLPIAAVRQLPEPQAVCRSDRCGPRRGKVWKLAASKCFTSQHSRCSGTGVPRSIPRNGVGMAHLGHPGPRGPSLAPWASEQSAYHKERVALDAARKSWEPLHRQLPRQARRLPPTSRKRSRRSSIAEMRKEAKGRVARKARKARGDQVRQGPARASSGASPARLLKEPVSGRLV